MIEKTQLPCPFAPAFSWKAWSAPESWRKFGIMSEFVETTERLGEIHPAASIVGFGFEIPIERPII